MSERARSLEELYVGSYARLVGIVGAVSGSQSEAEEAVQEAFIRLMSRWSTVSTYDDPEAWVRKVALGKVADRKRKFRNGLRALNRTAPGNTTPGPDGTAVDLAHALQTLSRDQRAVVVLRTLGLELTEIANVLDVPVGTVKSRLHRARAALAPLLRQDPADV